MNYQTYPKDILLEMLDEFRNEYRKIQAENLSLNMSRGKPGEEQLSLIEE